jgi:hypothetical protein
MNIFRKRVTPVIPTISRRVIPWTPRSPFVCAGLLIACCWIAIGLLAFLLGFIMNGGGS